jgi:hypothetical protein
MRPRWHFVLLSALSVIGAFILLLTLLYVTSLAMFFLRDSGAWYTPSFGGRGWYPLLHSLPWFLILLIVAFMIVLDLLVRRFAFVYKKPLLLSAIGILLLIFFGGFFIAQTPLHRMIMLSARHGDLPSPIDMLYRGPMRVPPPSDTYHGQILVIVPGGFTLVDEEGAGTTTVLVTPETRLPYGEDFKPGERVVVVGDTTATGTVRAFGIREIDEYPSESR